MKKQDFEELQQEFNRSEITLKQFLQQKGGSYSTYNYWSKKHRAESETLPIAPISIHETDVELEGSAQMEAMPYRSLNDNTGSGPG